MTSHAAKCAALASLIALAACSASSSAPSLLPSHATNVRAHWTASLVGHFSDPYGVAVVPTCSGACNVYVADPGDKAVYEVKPGGSRVTVLDSTFGNGFDPVGVAADRFGGIAIADKVYWSHGLQYSYMLYVYPQKHFGIAKIYPPGILHKWPQYYRSVAIFAPSELETAVYGAVATHLPHTTQGQINCGQVWTNRTSCAPLTTTPFNDPYGIAVDGSGVAYVADARDKKVYRLTRDLRAEDLGGTFGDPYGIAVTQDGRHVYVADAGSKVVWERSPHGVWSVIGQFADPYGVAVGADRTVYVADPGSKAVWKLTP